MARALRQRNSKHEHHKHYRRIRQLHKEVHQSVTLAVFLIVIMLTIGTLFFRVNEEWNWIDSFYFSGVTMTTVGHDLFIPIKDSSKVFIVFYSILTLGLILYSVSIIASRIVETISLKRTSEFRKINTFVS